MNAPREIDANRMLAVVAEVAREARPNLAPHITLDSSLEKELGLDSLARVELVLRLEKAFGASLPEQALATSETPRDLLRFLLSSAGHAPRAADTTVLSLVQEGDQRGDVRAPRHARTLTEALDYHVEKQGDRLTVFLYEEEKETQITYRQLWDNALGYASRLSEAGLRPGQMVAIMLPTCKEYLYSFYGVLLAGGVPVPLYPPARLTTIEDHMTRHVAILRSAGATILITIPEAKALAYLLRAQVESMRAVLMPADLEGGNHAGRSGFVPHAGKPGDIGFLQYTSGSTGNPKGVVLSHESLLVNVQGMGAAVSAGTSDVFVSWLPLYHDMGLIGGCFATMFLGFPVVLMSPLAFLSRPSAWMRAIHRHRGTISGGPNFSYELCLRRIDDKEMEGIDLSSWRFAFNGAEPVSPDTLNSFQERFSRWKFPKYSLSPVYGLAENTVGVSFTTPGTPWRMDVLDREIFSRTGEAIPVAENSSDKKNTIRVVGCGQVIQDHDLRVVDAAGHELPDGQEGSLQLRGPSATSGYYRNPEATRQLFQDGWLNTGDRAYLREGMVYITGREKDIIIRGGRNISPYELEQAVGDLGGVRRGCVAVFGSLDPATGTERVVVLAEMRDTDESRHESLKRMINELAVSLIGGPVDDIVLAPPASVPKTSSGKIRRVAAREFYERGPSSVRPQAVWLQFLRLVLAGFAPQLRRIRRALQGELFAWRGYLVFGILFPFAFLAAWLAPVRNCWNVGRMVSKWFLRLSGIPVVRQGELPERTPVVLAVNHTSYLDAVVLLSLLEYRGYAFVAKREFEGNFLMRTLLAGFGTRFIERFEVAKSAEHASELAEAAKGGVSLIVFPEGTLKRATGLMPFRTGAFQAAAQAGIPVVPIGLRGVRSVMRDGTWYLRRAAVTVSIGAPILAEGPDWAAAVKLRDAVRAEILRTCGEPDLAEKPAAAG
jgi:acyl carrier protein